MASNKTGGTKSKTKKASALFTEPQNQNEMKTTEIRDLIDFIAQSGLNEVDIETKELKLHVKRDPDQKVLKSSAQVMAAPVAVAPAAVAPVAALKSAKPVASGKNTVHIKSTITGTIYRS